MVMIGLGSTIRFNGPRLYFTHLVGEYDEGIAIQAAP
jgi:hypothetical protein